LVVYSSLRCWPRQADLDKPLHKPANILLRLLGPGLVTGAADDDPSGIATYSQAGAQFGHALLWTVFLTTPFMIAIQLVSAQIGRVTGKGIIANVRDFASRWLVISLVGTLVMANTFDIAADLAAMGGSLSLVIGGLSHEPDFRGCLSVAARICAVPALCARP
jgi:NRAMP (natural resistance-associated macrophage protein)-like metal ion transporter